MTMNGKWVSLLAPVGLAALLLGPAGSLACTRPAGAQPSAGEHHVETSSAPLTRAVQKAIQADEQLRGRNITASADLDGKVTLTGVVTNQAQKDHATDIAETVKGVSAVDNRLAVSSTGSVNPIGTARQAARETGQVLTDDWITTKVLSQLMATGSTSVKVATDQHVVTLWGTVPSDVEREKVVSIARTTDGVTRVVDAVKIAPRK